MGKECVEYYDSMHGVGHRYQTRRIRHEGGSNARSTTIPSTPYCVSYNVAGSGGTKESTNAITWSNGAKLSGAIGIDLSSRTGFRTNAKTEYALVTPGRLCGTHDKPNGTPRRLAGCSQGAPDSEDPTTGDALNLNLGFGRGSVCVPAPEDDETVFGDTLLRQEADEPVTITDVSLVDPEDMTLTKAFLVQVQPGESLGGMRYASDESGLPEKWDQRIEAEGAVVRPGDEWNVVLVVDSPPDLTASAKAARIRYEQAGTEHQQDTLTRILTADVSCEDALQEPAEGWRLRSQSRRPSPV